MPEHPFPASHEACRVLPARLQRQTPAVRRAASSESATPARPGDSKRRPPDQVRRTRQESHAMPRPRYAESSPATQGCLPARTTRAGPAAAPARGRERSRRVARWPMPETDRSATTTRCETDENDQKEAFDKRVIIIPQLVKGFTIEESAGKSSRATGFGGPCTAPLFVVVHACAARICRKPKVSIPQIDRYPFRMRCANTSSSWRVLASPLSRAAQLFEDLPIDATRRQPHAPQIIAVQEAAARAASVVDRCRRSRTSQSSQATRSTSRASSLDSARTATTSLGRAVLDFSASRPCREVTHLQHQIAIGLAHVQPAEHLVGRVRRSSCTGATPGRAAVSPPRRSTWVAVRH